MYNTNKFTRKYLVMRALIKKCKAKDLNRVDEYAKTTPLH